MRIRFMSQAQREVFEATTYYLKQSKEAADKFVLDLGDTTSLLLQFPRAGSQIEGEARRIVLKSYPY